MSWKDGSIPHRYASQQSMPHRYAFSRVREPARHIFSSGVLLDSWKKTCRQAEYWFQHSLEPLPLTSNVSWRV